MQSTRRAQQENSMPRENGLENQRVVIVGGSSGIGLAVADLAASQRAKVSIVSSNAERVHKAVKSVGGEAQGEAVCASHHTALAALLLNPPPFSPFVLPP